MNYRKKRAGDGDVKKVQVYLQPTKNEERLEAIRKEKEKEENEVCTGSSIRRQLKSVVV